MSLDLETRLRLGAPEPSPAATERARATVLRPRRRVRRRVLLAAAALVAALAAAPALALTIGLDGELPAATWTWEGVPGRATPENGLVRLVAEKSRIDPGSVRELVRADDPAGSRLLAASRAGSVCLAAGGRGVLGEFRCLDELLAPRLVAGREPALLHYESGGGDRPTRATWSTIVGVARSDVRRVVVRLADGSERELPLNAWRGFAYAGAGKERFPVALLAYTERRHLFGTDEVRLEEVLLERHNVPVRGPLCGGAAGPCNPELRRLDDLAGGKRDPDRTRTGTCDVYLAADQFLESGLVPDRIEVGVPLRHVATALPHVDRPA
ncbi:MAG: hypothetical protein ABR583_10385 [Gaiellaceae bacterium]